MPRQRRDLEFAAFYHHEAERVHRLALLLAGDRERASDLAQEAFLRTYRRWHHINENPGGYVRKTLVNLHRNARRRWFTELKYRSSQKELVEEPLTQLDQAIHVAETLRVLPPIRRATILLRFYEDMTEEQIANVLDRPLGTVKSDIHRALRKLRPLLEEPASEELA